MSRLPHKTSFNVVFCQHGIFDTVWTWLIHGMGESLGFQARDSGFDVFMGQYRGVYPRKLAKWKEERDGKDSFWDYGIDHIARWDIYGFLTKIFEIKVHEYKAANNCEGMTDQQIRKFVRSKLKITYIGHSLGGMILPMYVVYSKLLKRPDHFLSKAILLSPAGTHFHANWVIKIIGQFFTYFAPLYTTNTHFPEYLLFGLQKLINDTKKMPAVDDLINYLCH